ncbi:Dual specificity protein phosphatase PPS1 [Grifola frondosa]|uniref:Dual specificity protein phosphatase PPS1 n=1 Tax=Grifola frondosa TaxID=5627 RepID=A0A1C7M9V2_GRIFR|nr:Dual specificity protein phosphatase PPS1 [Grifola frondosa]
MPFFPSSASPQSAYTRMRSTSATFLPSSPTSSSCSSSPTTLTSSPTDSTAPVSLRTHLTKLLILYYADGYTESSALALSMLMSLRTLSLPEAYLTLQASTAHPTRTRSESEADVLGNHASNAFMLHALGITHVVSGGECALVPPSNVDPSAPAFTSCTEREDRIKVLAIKGVCDDGINMLDPQLEPICNWIEKARAEGGKVLVHCRVGISQSATATIAYVIKHLSLPLVDAYLIVRSRRLSVLIQPNMRLLYNLLRWEMKLARSARLMTPNIFARCWRAV